MANGLYSGSSSVPSFFFLFFNFSFFFFLYLCFVFFFVFILFFPVVSPLQWLKCTVEKEKARVHREPFCPFFLCPLFAFFVRLRYFRFCFVLFFCFFQFFLGGSGVLVSVLHALRASN